MRIYYDTEFSSVSSDTDLISAGFVTEYGKEFYIELDGVARANCSQFVQDIVYPLLRSPGVKVCTEFTAAQHIVDWLKEQADEVTLVADSHWDGHLISRLIHRLYDYQSKISGSNQMLSSSLSIRYGILGFSDDIAAREFQQGYTDYFSSHPGMEHHALHDARALKQGVMRSEGFYA